MPIKGKKTGKKLPTEEQRKERGIFLKSVGERLRKAREERNISQVDIAKAIGVQQSLISKAEAGVTGLNLFLFWKLCEALGVSADEVLGIYNP